MVIKRVVNVFLLIVAVISCSKNPFELEEIGSPGNLPEGELSVDLSSRDKAVQISPLNQWHEKGILQNEIRWYYFVGKEGSTYAISLEDSQDNSTYTADVDYSCYYPDSNSSFYNSKINTSGLLYTLNNATTNYLKIISGPGGYYRIKIEEDKVFWGDTREFAIEMEGTDWVSGSINPGKKKWYYFIGTNQQDYEIFFDDLNDGSGGYNADISVDVYYGSSTSSSKYASSGYSNPLELTSPSTQKIFVRVNGTGDGNYRIKYQPWFPEPGEVRESAIFLHPENTWYHDSIEGGSSVWFYFYGTNATSYELNFDDLYNGSGAKTANVTVYGYYGNNTSYSFSDTSGFTTPKKFTANKNEKIYFKVVGYNNGTYGIKYKTWKPTPGSTREDAILLDPEDTWYNHSIENGNAVWFYFNVTNSSPYNLYFDDSNEGSGTKTANVTVYGYYGTSSSQSFSDYSGYITPFKFTPNLNQRVYFKVTGSSGSFAIKYDEWEPSPGDTRDSAILLTPIDTWNYASILSSKSTWYYFNATQGESYELKVDDSYNGSGSMSANVTTYLYYGSSTSYFSYKSSAYITPYIFTAASTGPVYIKISGGTGNIGLKYRSYVPEPGEIRDSAIEITPFNSWFTTSKSSSKEKWYYIDCNAGKIYDLYLDDQYGSGSYTANVTLYGYKNDSTSYTLYSSGNLTSPKTFTPTGNDRYYFKVSNGIGTFAIKIDERTAILGETKVNPIQMTTQNLWTTYNVPSSGEIWFSVNAAANVTTKLYWDDSYQGTHTKTQDVMVYRYIGNSANYDTSRDSGYNTPLSHTASYARVIYYKVTPYSGNGTGTFAIKYVE